MTVFLQKEVFLLKDVAITYLGGSGFLVLYDEHGFLFDASLNGVDHRIFPKQEILAGVKHLYVFISHHHDDHFDPSIYEKCPENSTYFLGYDIPDSFKGTRMTPGEEISEGDLTVHAFDSTDEGVSFLLTFHGLKLFHAGDLNFWHWRDDSTVTEIEAAEQAFYACVEPIPKQSIDISFFPVDPRQGNMYDAGARYFIMNFKPKTMFPMHFYGREDVPVRFAVTNEDEMTKIIPLKRAGDHVDLVFPEDRESDPGARLKAFVTESTEPIPKPEPPQEPVFDDDDEEY